MTRFNSGLVGTERDASFFGASGVWTVNEQTLLKGRSMWPRLDETTDPYIGYVSLLLKMNGANGSTAFTDSSLYNNTVTANGNAQISTAQSRFDGASAYFDGSGDFLSFPNNSLFAFGAAPFTIEMWIYQAGTPNGSAVISEQYTGPGDAVAFSIGFCSGSAGSTTGSRPFFGLYNGSSWTGAVSATSLNNNQWYHIAGVRSGNTLTLYIDGVSVATTTTTYSIGVDEQIFIGKRWDASGTPSDFNGYIDELRVTKGIARYVSTFQPRTTPFPTTTGNTGDLYYPSVSLLLHMDGSNGSTTFTDSSSNALTVTANGNAQISTAQSKFGDSSLLLDGTDDFLSLGSNALFDLTGDFTIELFARLSSFANNPVLVGRWGASNRCWLLGVSSTQITFVTGNNGAIDQIITRTPSTSLLVNTWHHFAVTRLGSTVRIFLDGVQAGANGTASGNCSGVQTVVVGVNGDGNVNDFNGYIDEVRITKGISRYNTTSFTVPTTAFPNSL
jgi:hypothetical protein